MKQVTIVCDLSSLGNGKGNPRAAAVVMLELKCIGRLRRQIRSFDQLFVISNDDTFDSYMDHEIRVEK